MATRKTRQNGRTCFKGQVSSDAGTELFYIRYGFMQIYPVQIYAGRTWDEAAHFEPKSFLQQKSPFSCFIIYVSLGVREVSVYVSTCLTKILKLLVYIRPVI